MSDLSQDSWSVPVANHGMVVLSYIVIFVEFIYVLILIFAYHTLSSNSKDGAKWKLSYSNPRPMWMMQIAASLAAIYKAIFCILAVFANDEISCNVFWKNSIFANCVELWIIYSFLMEKDQAVNHARSPRLNQFAVLFKYSLLAIPPTSFIVVFFGVNGFVRTLHDSQGYAIYSGAAVCAVAFETWALVLFQICDFVVSFVSLMLFVHPLRQIIRSAQVHQFPGSQKYQRVVIENAIACFISVLLGLCTIETIFMGRAWHTLLFL
jgi:hypothetical protein